MIVAGIDEAGYGPLLGPLVITAVAIEMCDDQADADLWQTWKSTIRRAAGKADGRIMIDDSKKVYRNKSDLGRLERSVCALLGHSDNNPRTLADLLRTLCPDTIDDIARHPWYGSADVPLPVACETGDANICTAMLRRQLDSSRMRIDTISSRVISESNFNRIVARTHNKSALLFAETATLMLDLQRRAGTQDVLILADRQGGRVAYHRELLRVFDGWDLQVEQQQAEQSSYCLRRSGCGTIRIRFTTSADSQHATAAMASMISKYVRQLLMQRLNDYFAARAPDILPTAGYYKDARRYLDELHAAGALRNIDMHTLVRSR